VRFRAPLHSLISSRNFWATTGVDLDLHFGRVAVNAGLLLGVMVQMLFWFRFVQTSKNSVLVYSTLKRNVRFQIDGGERGGALNSSDVVLWLILRGSLFDYCDLMTFSSRIQFLFRKTRMTIKNQNHRVRVHC
jgi:hypothetical protein